MKVEKCGILVFVGLLRSRDLTVHAAGRCRWRWSREEKGQDCGNRVKEQVRELMTCYKSVTLMRV